MKYMPEIIRIINGGLDGDVLKVQAYADLLATKLAADGDADAANSIHKALNGIGRDSIVAKDSSNAQ